VGGAGRSGGAVVGGDGRSGGTVVGGDGGAAGAAGVGAGADRAAGFLVRGGAVVVVGDRRCGAVALGGRRGSATSGRRGAAAGGLDGGASGGLDPPGGATTSGTSRGDASLPGDPLSAPVPATAAIDQPASNTVRPMSIAPRGGRRCCMVRLRWSWSD
jgi:hypothetical protein